jgi:hypothetical protein
MLEAFEQVAAGRQMPSHEQVTTCPHWSRMAETVLYWLAAAPWEPMPGGMSDFGDSGSPDHRADGGRDPGRRGE